MKRSVLGLLVIIALYSCSEKNTSKVKAPIRVVTEVVHATNGENGQTYVICPCFVMP